MTQETIVHLLILRWPIVVLIVCFLVCHLLLKLQDRRLKYREKRKKQSPNIIEANTVCQDNPASANKLSKDDATSFRRRIEYEDGLLNNRMTIILILNTLAAMAVLKENPRPLLFVCVSSLMIIIDICWVLCAYEAFKFIQALIIRLKESRDTAPPDEVFRWDVTSGFITRRIVPFGPTMVITIVLPLLLLFGWIVVFIVTLWPILI